MPVDCTHFEERDSAAHSGFAQVVEFSLMLIWFPFAIKFIKQLWEMPDRNALVWSVIAYALFVACYISCSLWWFIIEPLRQSSFGFSLGGCAFLEFFGKLTAIGVYSCLIEVLVFRLQISFAESSYEVSKTTLRIFHGVNMTNGIVILMILFVQCTKIDCAIPVHSGLLYRMNMAKREYHACELPEDDITHVGIYTASFVIFFLNLALAVLFVSKLRAVIRDGDSLDRGSNASCQQNAELRLLVEKACVVGLASISTYALFFCLVAALRLSPLMSVDAAMNLVFLYCGFFFGNDMYYWVFGPCISLFRRSNTTKNNRPRIDFLPSNTINEV